MPQHRIITWLQQIVEALQQYPTVKAEREQFRQERDAAQQVIAEAEPLIQEIMDALGIGPDTQ